MNSKLHFNYLDARKSIILSPAITTGAKKAYKLIRAFAFRKFIYLEQSEWMAAGLARWLVGWMNQGIQKYHFANQHLHKIV